MPLYSFRCRECGHQETVSRPIHQGAPPYPCARCNSLMRRDYKEDRPFNAPVWQSHYNPTTGTVVSDKRQMQDTFDRYSDQLYEKTGIEQRNVVIDRGDMAAMKGDSE